MYKNNRRGSRRTAGALLIALTLLSLASCRRGSAGGELLSGEKLFTIQVGVLEDEIDLFHRGYTLPNRKNRIFMYQGLIFVGNSLGGKIMEFSSYGDLISLRYNENSNPRPVLLSQRQDDAKIVNKVAVPFPFSDIGDIAVTSDHILLVEDHVPPERRLIDQDSGSVLQHVIHRFAADGEHLDYIGQEGVGGTPFPYVHSVEITANDDLVVTTRNGSAHEVFWYGSGGDVRFRVRIDEAHLPAGEDPSMMPSLSRIYPDMNRSRLYLHLNFLSEERENIDSRIYTLELPSGIYSGYFDLPDNIQSLPGPRGMEQIQYLYDFIGTAENGHLFFLSRNNSLEQSLLIMDSDGNLVARRLIRMDDPELMVTDFQVSREGIITGLLGNPDGVNVFWWRADALIN
jgi:hypothetical protein